jgi:hypothetical protein
MPDGGVKLALDKNVSHEQRNVQAYSNASLHPDYLPQRAKNSQPTSFQCHQATIRKPRGR